MKISKMSIIGFIVSFVLIYYVFTYVVSVNGILEILPFISIPLFIVSDIPYLIQSFIMGYKLKYILDKCGKKVGYWNCFFSNSLGMFFSNISFGRSGYLGAVIGLEGDKSTSVGVVSGTIVVDIIARGFIVILSLLFFDKFFIVSNEILLAMRYVVVIGVIFMIVGFIVLFFGSKIKLPQKFANLVSSFDVVRKYWLTVFLFSIAGWILRGFEWYILARACGFELSYIQCMIIHPLATVMRLIPISISGMGFVEITMVTLLPFIAPEKLVIFSMCDMVNNFLVDWVGLKVLVKK